MWRHDFIQYKTTSDNFIVKIIHLINQDIVYGCKKTNTLIAMSTKYHFLIILEVFFG